MVIEALQSVRVRIKAVLDKLGVLKDVRLVAVSKKKPVQMLFQAYEAGHRHFGENYVQELVEKASSLPKDIQWHFIGHLQSRKCKDLLSIPNLVVLETVDSQKLAEKLNKVCHELDRYIDVYVQVNTSGEGSKNGVPPSGSADLCGFIKNHCHRLHLKGLMTIGEFSQVPHPRCFEILRRCRNEVADTLDMDKHDLELSMGMSNDFELAVS